MAAVPVVNNLPAQRSFFMIKIHGQNLSTFIKILINYDKELEEIEAEISGLEKRREDDKELESEYQEWVDKFSEYVDIDKLTRGIVIELIERIDVSEDGSICIHYRFKNPYED